ncbi:MAG: chorismate synthase [Lachnospiraceae bacterium]
MAGSTLGTIFKITTWGESHGKALGVVIDGCPAGLSLTESDIQLYLNRRKPGQNKYTTPRVEGDLVQILSGVFEGKTTGTSISLLIENTSQRSHDYSEISNFYRPGHADFTFDAKYGFRDYRGGGRSSGRETVSRVAAGAIAILILKELGIEITTYTSSIGPISMNDYSFDKEAILQTPTYMPNFAASEKASQYLEQCMNEEDSSGGVIECIIKGAPVGIGEPVFEKLDANLAKAILSVGATKAIEFGDGIQVALEKGSTNNDAFYMSNGKIVKKTNHSGGILGGMSDGDELIFKTYIKPTPSIHKTQQTVNKQFESIDINIKGRHDPVIVPRAVVVIESMAALTLLDLMLVNMTTKLDCIKDFYKKN